VPTRHPLHERPIAECFKIRHNWDAWGLPSKYRGRPKLEKRNEKDLFSSDLSFCSTDVDPVDRENDLRSSAACSALPTSLGACYP
jgi:hypothetical protein